jgi:hypothetical protein
MPHQELIAARPENRDILAYAILQRLTQRLRLARVRFDPKIAPLKLQNERMFGRADAFRSAGRFTPWFKVIDSHRTRLDEA